uniref:ORF2 n=1 Tax=Acanthamoeba polyphaga TaxID=5757 RepID=A0A0S0ILG0_ACAPO|nr:ORF2 [Acanthamoeba polyphaga]
MPQLDKISFATQYFWLTLFFFGLYFLSVNFFVILVFKNLKLRNIIYKIWYFFLYKFDYADYNNKHKNLINSSFSSVYFNLYVNFFIPMKINFIFEKMKSMINKTQTLDQSKSLLINKSLNNILNSNLIGLSKRFQEVNIDEI